MDRLSTVLVVEDDDDIRALVRHRLEQAGLRVLAAGSGEAGIALAAEHAPDLLLLDIGLPDGDGFEICSRVLAGLESTPAVIFLTARDAVSDRVAGLAAGAVDYVVKPFDSAELLARVQAALRTKLRADDLARRIRGSVRASDLVFRYGGEEFLVLLPDTGRAGAEAAAAKLLEAVGGETVEVPGVGELTVTVSVGVSSWGAELADVAELVAEADGALYRAKRLGRARVATAR